MKFAIIVLLGFCALSAQSANTGRIGDDLYSEISRNGILEGVGKAIEEIIEKIKETIKQVKEQIVAITQEAIEKVKQFVQNAKDVIKTIRESIEESLSELGEAAKECLEKYRPQINEIVVKANNDLAECGQKATAEIKEIVNGVRQEIHEVEALVQKLRDVVATCVESSSKPAEAVKCALDNTTEIRKDIFERIIKIKKSIENARERVNEIISKAQTCATKVVQDFNDELEAIKAQVIECVKESQKH